MSSLALPGRKALGRTIAATASRLVKLLAATGARSRLAERLLAVGKLGERSASAAEGLLATEGRLRTKRRLAAEGRLVAEARTALRTRTIKTLGTGAIEGTWAVEAASGAISGRPRWAVAERPCRTIAKWLGTERLLIARRVELTEGLARSFVTAGPLTAIALEARLCTIGWTVARRRAAAEGRFAAERGLVAKLGTVAAERRTIAAKRRARTGRERAGRTAGALESTTRRTCRAIPEVTTRRTGVAAEVTARRTAVTAKIPAWGTAVAAEVAARRTRIAATVGTATVEARLATEALALAAKGSGLAERPARCVAGTAFARRKWARSEVARGSRSVAGTLCGRREAFRRRRKAWLFSPGFVEARLLEARLVVTLERAAIAVTKGWLRAKRGFTAECWLGSESWAIAAERRFRTQTGANLAAGLRGELGDSRAAVSGLSRFRLFGRLCNCGCGECRKVARNVQQGAAVDDEGLQLARGEKRVDNVANPRTRCQGREECLDFVLGGDDGLAKIERDQRA